MNFFENFRFFSKLGVLVLLDRNKFICSLLINVQQFNNITLVGNRVVIKNSFKTNQAIFKLKKPIADNKNQRLSVMNPVLITMPF